MNIDVTKCTVLKKRLSYLGTVGGAGGKGVWGKPGSESDNVANTDKNDPNYDSDSLESANVELTSVMPELTDEELKVNSFTITQFLYILFA